MHTLRILFRVDKVEVMGEGGHTGGGRGGRKGSAIVVGAARSWMGMLG